MISKLKESGLQASQLKWIAIMTMTLDHVYKVFAVFWAPKIAVWLGIGWMGSEYVLMALFGIGCATMYIFAWFIAEGCRYTRNIRKYIGRLLLFGLVAEVPFQLMVDAIMEEELLITFGLTNIMFTFALGAMACYGYQSLSHNNKALALGIPVICALLAHFLHTDYGAYGVLVVFICYLIEEPKQRLIVLTSVIILVKGVIFPLQDIMAYGFEVSLVPYYLISLAYALVSIPLLALYNGQRGNQSKYAFYIFYPLHMTVLVLIYGYLI